MAGRFHPKLNPNTLKRIHPTLPVIQKALELEVRSELKTPWPRVGSWPQHAVEPEGLYGFLNDVFVAVRAELRN